MTGTGVMPGEGLKLKMAPRVETEVKTALGKAESQRVVLAKTGGVRVNRIYSLPLKIWQEAS
jgi:hypothetical protein